MADCVGQQLGNYRLMRLFGEGDFDEVYLGEHIRLETQAAIKVLYTQLARDGIEQFVLHRPSLKSSVPPPSRSWLQRYHS